MSDLCRTSCAVPEADDRCLEPNGDNGINNIDNIDWELFFDSRDDQPLLKLISKFALQPNHSLSAMDIVFVFPNASNSVPKKGIICGWIQIVGALQMRIKGPSQWRFLS
jgi:hypothetical protein